MTNTGNVRNDVWRLIDRDPSIRLDLERELINIRALARYCSKSGVKGSADAIISAIRRYPRESELSERYGKAVEIVGKSSISTKSRIANISLVRGAEIQDILQKLFSCVNYERGETLRLVQGEESIKLIVDEKNVEKMLGIIPERLVLNVLKGLSEINIHLDPLAVKTPGIMFVLCGELTRNNINIYEITSCVPEMLVFVKEKDILKAHQVLFDLCRGHSG